MRFVLFIKLLLLPLVSIYSVEADIELDEDLGQLPGRRSICMDVSIASSRLKGDTATRLITMVTCFPEYAKELHLRESKIIRLIKQNPGASNPYSDEYNAHLITLAARYGHVNIVKAIAECNPQSLYCFGVYERAEENKIEENGIEKIIKVVKVFERETPLDEAVLFRKKKVARFLHNLGAPLKKVSQEQLDTLLSE